MTDDINMENSIRMKMEKGLPISPQENGRAVRVLVKALNTVAKELEALKEKVDELSLSRSKVDTNPQGTGEQTAIRPKQKL